VSAPDLACSVALRALNLSSPRTCKRCGLGPCQSTGVAIPDYSRPPEVLAGFEPWIGSDKPVYPSGNPIPPGIAPLTPADPTAAFLHDIAVAIHDLAAAVRERREGGA